MTVVDQTWIVIAGSAAIFSLGLLLFATPVCRSNLFWLALAIGCLGLAVLRPEIEIVLVQALGVGGAMVLLTTLLRKILLSPPKSQSSEWAVSIQPSSNVMMTRATSTEHWIGEEEADLTVERTSASSIHSHGPAP